MKARRMEASSWIDLYWLPLGAGGLVVQRCGRLFEWAWARHDQRHPQPLFHSALELTHRGARYVIEMAPVWSDPTPGRGVLVEGPVGLGVLGHLRRFRYEVRCWRDGQIPDRLWAVDSPQRLSEDEAVAGLVLAHVARVPALTWGQDEAGLGEMWNSNSLVSWLLASGGLDTDGLAPPRGGRAPGWQAGLALAGRADRRRTREGMVR